MATFPSLNELQVGELNKILALGCDDGFEVRFGLNMSDPHRIYPHQLVIAGIWSDEREFRLWVEDDQVQVICAIPDEEEDEGYSFYNLDSEDELHINTALQLIAVNLLPEYTTTNDEFEQFMLHVLGDLPVAPIEMPVTVEDRWAFLADSFEKAGQLTRFEWSEWGEMGIDALNELSLLTEHGISIKEPDYDQLEQIQNADDWEAAVFEYFNAQLDEADLILFAIGEYFDEYQEFLLVPKTDMRAMNVSMLANRLGLVIR
jgi:hypothetical protein